MLKQSKMLQALRGEDCYLGDRLAIVPEPPIRDTNGSASVDLHLGRWFLTLRGTQHHVFSVDIQQDYTEANLTDRHFVRFDREFVLHPRSFVLGATLEWIKIPHSLTGSVVGKSSWGRRGLIIETAPTVHPGFSGCLTLELTNVGEIPIALKPGTPICQLQLQTAFGEGTGCGPFDGLRRPALGRISIDDFAKRLWKQT